MIYAAATVSVVLALILNFEPRYGQKNMLVYLGICSLMGSLTVIMSMIKMILKEVSYQCCRLWIAEISVCSDSVMLQCYSAAIRQHCVLNDVSRNNNDLFKFHYAKASI